MEERFLRLLDSLRPKPSFVRLFHEIVLDVWKQELHASQNTRSRLEARISEQNARLSQLDDAFIYRSAIDQETYQSERDRLREQRSLAELELNSSTNEALDVEGLLRFAENALMNARSLWLSASVAAKQDIQRTFFPEGLQFDGSGFGTVVTCLPFNQLRESERPKQVWRPQREPLIVARPFGLRARSLRENQL